jgi:hypothetical protein
MSQRNDSTQTCPDCGAVNPAGAANCWLCYLPFFLPLEDQAKAPPPRHRKSLFRRFGTALSAFGTMLMIGWGGIIAFMAVCTPLGGFGTNLLVPRPGGNEDLRALFALVLILAGFVLGIMAAAKTMRILTIRWTGQEPYSTED